MSLASVTSFRAGGVFEMEDDTDQLLLVVNCVFFRFALGSGRVWYSQPNIASPPVETVCRNCTYVIGNQ